VTDTSPPTPPAQSATPGQPATAGPHARPAPGVPYPPPPPGYYPPPGYGPVPPRGYILVPLSPDGRPLAGFGDRLLAYIIDALIMGAVAMLIWVPAMIWWFQRFAVELTRMDTSYDPSDQIPAETVSAFLVGYLILFGVILVATLGISYIYLVEMSWRSGQTIGKRAMKLQVAPAEPGAQRSRMMFVKRWAVERVGGAFLPFFSYLDGLWQLWDKPLQQCLHDKAAHTVVVKIG
jgi:uncharacterized RDD family membrane protein YckC